MNRKNLFKQISLLAVCFTVCLVASCSTSVKSHPETEQEIDGTWETVAYEHEDGATLKMDVTMTYDADNHTFEGKIKMNLTSPVSMWMATVSYSGTWSASEEQLLGKIDKNSIDFSFSDMIDDAEQEELKQDCLKELKDGGYLDGGEILSISSDEMKIKDETDGTVYEYKRK